MTEFSFKTTTFILLLVLTLLLTISPALAQDGANVYLQPVESTDDTITVDVTVENISNMYGAEFRLRYDPAILAAQDMIPDQNGMQIEVGTLLPIDKGFVVANKIDEATGEIIFAMTLLNPAPPAEGSGPLARVSFKVLQNSPTVLNVEHAKLVAADLQTIPSQTGSMNIGSAPAAAESSESQSGGSAPVTTIDMPSVAGSSSFPWWIVAVLVMVLGVLALGGLIVMGGKSKSTAKKSASMKRATPTRQMPPQQPVQSKAMKQQPATRSRPSAFKQPPTMPTDLSQK